MTSQSASLFRAAPVLLVKDVKAAAVAYHDRMGFEVLGYWGDAPGFSIVRRGPVTLMLAVPWKDEPFRANASYERPDAYVYVDDVDAVHAEFVERGAQIVCPPEDQPHGCREIIVQDLDGHHLIFGQDLER